MNIQLGANLANYSTMRLGGRAEHLVAVHTPQELIEALEWAHDQGLAVIMIGDGSNIVWRDEGFAGLLIIDKITGYLQHDEDDSNVYITVGAGENWDTVVARTAEAGLSGIESLSLIPGTCGATPIQNVGAYGQEIAQTLTAIQAIDGTTNELITIAAADCGFGYRTSRFKTIDRGRFYITAITLHLTLKNPEAPFYPALEQYLSEHSITNPTPLDIRSATIAIRQAKLPDPAIVANNGSFFANPIIDQALLAKIIASVSAAPPQWPAGNGQCKIPAAWLIEQAGFKDFHDSETGMGTWPSQALVLVNESANSTADLLTFKQKIVSDVQSKFGVTLEQEPELLPLEVAR